MESSTCTVQAIDHVGIAVHDLDAAIAFFHRTFGIQPGDVKTSHENGVRVCLLQVGETRIELLSPLSAESPMARFLERRGEGLHHLAFRVNTISQRLKAAEALGLQLVDREPRRGISGTIAFIHPKSVYGVLTELVEPYKDER
jgi:methylmalonyl-CoA epimerase